MNRTLKTFMLVTDIGFVVYWLITLAKIIPAELLFRDYSNPIIVHWNWSFLPLDLLVSATGIASVILFKRGNPVWLHLALVSLTLTSVSGLQAIAYWAIAGDFEPWWWAPNLFLLIYPLFFMPRLMRVAHRQQ